MTPHVPIGPGAVRRAHPRTLASAGRALLACCALALFASGAHAAPFVYVANFGFLISPTFSLNANSVSVIDAATATVVGTIPGGSIPIAVAVNPAGTRVYVADFFGYPGPGTVTVIDTETNGIVASITVGWTPVDIAINPAGTFVYVANAGPGPDGTVSVIDTSTNRVVATIPLGPVTGGIAVNPAGTRLYVAGQAVTGRIFTIDTATNTVIGTPVSVGVTGLGGVAVNPAGTFVYVTEIHNGRVSVIDTATNSVVASVTVGTNPVGIAISGSVAYVVNGGDNTVSRFSTSTNTVIGSPIPVGDAPVGIAIDRTGTLAYVTNGGFKNGDPSVTVISTASGNVVGSPIVVGSAAQNSAALSPAGIAVGPAAISYSDCPGQKPDFFYTRDTVKQLVTDRTTGLTWKQCSEGQSGATCAGSVSTMTWAQGLVAGASSAFAGFTDWRLPNAKELESLVQFGCASPSINKTVFPSTGQEPYWSSTTYAADPTKAWFVNFNNGATGTNFAKSSSEAVRLVRGGQPQDAFDRAATFAPAPFAFTAQTGVALSSTITSNTITLSGLATPTGIRISGGTGAQYSVDSGPYTSNPGTVVNGDTVAVQQTSSAITSTTTTVTLTVGGVSGGFSVTTTAIAPPPPSKLAIPSVNGGSDPAAAVAFDVVVQARDGTNAARNVAASTAVVLSRKTGTGALGGTVGCTIAAGSSSCTVGALTYSKAEAGVALTATRTSGDALAAGDSASFTVEAPTLLTSIVPASGPPSGGTEVRITGPGLDSAANVKVGGIQATAIRMIDATSMIATIPTTLTPGAVYDVTVLNPDGHVALLSKGFFADFLDVPQAYLYHAAIEKIVRAGITTGCGGGNYCPGDPVTRDAMAKFLLVAKHGLGFSPPAPTGNVFCDVTVSTFLGKWIEELKVEGIASGAEIGSCGKPNYHPTSVVTRDAMAKFLELAKNGSAFSPPAATGTVFCDVTASTFLAKWMEQLKADNITSGCGGGSCGKPDYCPTGTVSRGEMAKFLKIAFGL